VTVCICGTDVYGDRDLHDCCAHYGADCPACTASHKAEAEWLRHSTICPDCGRRSRYRGPRCPVCTRALEDDDCDTNEPDPIPT